MFEPQNVNGRVHLRPTADELFKRQTLHKTPHTCLDILEHAPGEFDWRAQADLTAWILSGSAEVCLDDGRALSLKPGCALFLPRGLNGRWVVKECLKSAVVWSD